MVMQAYRVQGRFLMGRTWSRFTVETADETEEGARERVLSTMGSRHRVDRQHVEIHDVEAISADEVTDPVVERRLRDAGE